MTKIKKTLAEIHHKYRSITLYIYIYIYSPAVCITSSWPASTSLSSQHYYHHPPYCLHEPVHWKTEIKKLHASGKTRRERGPGVVDCVVRSAINLILVLFNTVYNII
jgi:hypothetical protein